jgi:hypothetical protein
MLWSFGIRTKGAVPMVKRIFLLCALAFSLAGGEAILGCAPAAARESEEASAWRRAEGLLNSGRGEEAYALFSGLLAKFPGHNALRLGLARAAVLSGRPREAEPVYAELSAKFPDVPAIAAEKETVRRMLAGENVPSPSPTVWSGSLRAGLIYDSNANTGTASEELTLGDWLVRIPDAKRRQTLAAYLGALLNVNRRFGASGSWSFVGDMQAFLRGNGNPALGRLHNREWQWGRIAGGLRYGDDANLLDVRCKGETLDYEFDNSVTAVGPELTYIRALTEKMQLISSVNAEWRFYRSAFDDRIAERNGFYGQAGESLRFFWGEDARYSFSVGGCYLWGEPRDRATRYRYQGASIPLAITWKATEALDVAPHASITWEIYDSPATVLESANRRDKRLRGGLDATFRLTDGWSVEAGYAYVKNDSTSALYTYDQHTVTVGIAWSF